MKESYAEVLRILKKHTKLPTEEMNGDTLLAADLGLTSFDVVNIVCEFEDAFDMDIPDKDIRKFQTIGDIAAYVERQ